MVAIFDHVFYVRTVRKTCEQVEGQRPATARQEHKVTQTFGAIYYVELPARDIACSAAFYRDVFGWNVRSRGDGATGFDDGPGAVSGVWTTERAPVDDPGLRLYISVQDAEDAESRIEAAGGTIVTPPDMSLVGIVATFRDPAGNLLAIHQYKPENAS
jgi:predicted enzyme related to lactoylglutathione lyase